MASPTPHNVFVGCETGILKGINLEKSKWENISSVETVDKKNEICCMCWASSQQNQIHFATRNQVVKTYCVRKREVIHTQSCEGGSGPIRGIDVHQDTIVTCAESGSLKVWRNAEEQLEVNTGENISRMRLNPQQSNLTATGGKENDLKVWDLNNTDEPVFSAKNVRNDWLNLRVPVWILDMAFLENSQKIVTCTGHHQVRLYDPSTPQRRPVMDIEFDEYPLTSLSLRPGKPQVIVGNTHGQMALIDLRKGRMVQQYKGFAGSIRSIQCSQSAPVVASCGLDRYLRIHDINTKQLLQKFYLKSRLNCVLFTTDASGSAGELDNKVNSSHDSQEINAQEVDEIWENMPTVGSKKHKRQNPESANSTDQHLSREKRKKKSHKT